MTIGDPAMHATLKHIESLLEQLVEQTKRPTSAYEMAFGAQETKDGSQAS